MNIDKDQAQRVADRRYSIDGTLAKVLVGRIADVTFAKVQAKAYALAVMDLCEYISHTTDCGVNQPRGSYRFSQGCDCGLEDIIEP